jgi:hypothetical protein
MQKPTYKITSSADGLWYEFDSSNNDKTIRKAVGYYLYTEENKEYAELTFGDVLPNGSINLKITTDNKEFSIKKSFVSCSYCQII